MSRTKLITIGLFAALSFLVLIYGGIFGFDDAGREDPRWTANTAPDFQLKDLDGKPFKLSDFRGKTVLLNFWASWCAPCIKEFPSMLELLEREGDSLVLIAVSHDDSLKDIHRFLNMQNGKYSRQLKKANLVLAWDEDKKLGRDTFNVLRVPETFILDGEQRMVRKVAGELDWAGPQMREFLKSLKSKK